LTLADGAAEVRDGAIDRHHNFLLEAEDVDQEEVAEFIAQHCRNRCQDGGRLSGEQILSTNPGIEPMISLCDFKNWA